MKLGLLSGDPRRDAQDLGPAQAHPPRRLALGRARRPRRGLVRPPGKSRVLEPGMVFTIEPGIYIPAEHAGRRSEVVEHRRADRGHDPRDQDRRRGVPLLRRSAGDRRRGEGGPGGPLAAKRTLDVSAASSGRATRRGPGCARSPCRRGSGSGVSSSAVAVDLDLDGVRLERADLDFAAADDPGERRSRGARTRPARMCRKSRNRRHVAPVGEEHHVEHLPVQARVRRDDPVSRVAAGPADDGERRLVRDAVDRRPPAAGTRTEGTRRHAVTAIPMRPSQRLSSGDRLALDAGVEARARPEQERAVVRVREAGAVTGTPAGEERLRALRNRAGSCSSRASTFDVPPGRIASGTSEPARPRGRLRDRAVASAHGDQVERRAAGTCARSRWRRRRPLVGAFTSSMPRRRCRSISAFICVAAVALAGDRVVDEQAALHGPAPVGLQNNSPSRRGGDDAQVPVGRGRRDAAARRALQEAGLQQVGLVEVLERAAVLAERRGDRADADGAAAELLDDRREDPPVELVEPVLVHLQPGRAPRARRLQVDRVLAGDLREVAQAPQQPVGDARRAAAARRRSRAPPRARSGSRGSRPSGPRSARARRRRRSPGAA